jgi:hypothetical protein
MKDTACNPDRVTSSVVGRKKPPRRKAAIIKRLKSLRHAALGLRAGLSGLRKELCHSLVKCRNV